MVLFFFVSSLAFVEYGFLLTTRRKAKVRHGDRPKGGKARKKKGGELTLRCGEGANADHDQDCR